MFPGFQHPHERCRAPVRLRLSEYLLGMELEHKVVDSLSDGIELVYPPFGDLLDLVVRELSQIHGLDRVREVPQHSVYVDCYPHGSPYLAANGTMLKIPCFWLTRNATCAGSAWRPAMWS